MPVRIFMSIPVAVGVAAAVLVSCGGSGENAADRPICEAPTPVAEKGLPRRVPLSSWGTITEVSERGGFVGAEAIGKRKIVELYPEIVRALTASGHTYLGGDNEGFEAELSFADRRGRLTTFTLRNDECRRVVVRTLIEIDKEHG